MNDLTNDTARELAESFYALIGEELPDGWEPPAPTSFTPPTDQQKRELNLLLDMTGLRQKVPTSSTTVKFKDVTLTESTKEITELLKRHGIETVTATKKNFFTHLRDGSSGHYQCAIQLLRGSLKATEAQKQTIRLLTMKAGVPMRKTTLEGLSKKRATQIISGAQDLFQKRALAQPGLPPKKENLQAKVIEEQHARFRARYRPVQPYGVDDIVWNAWLTQKPNDIIGWDQWLSRKPL
jgi:hypothetical protein